MRKSVFNGSSNCSAHKLINEEDSITGLMPSCSSPTNSYTRIRPFLADPTAKILTGPRRLPKSKLLDEVIKEIREADADANIIRISRNDAAEELLKQPDKLVSMLMKKLKSDVKNYLVIDEANQIYNLENLAQKIISQTTYEIEIYFGQDLCHQVPACFRWIASIQD